MIPVNPEQRAFDSEQLFGVTVIRFVRSEQGCGVTDLDAGHIDTHVAALRSFDARLPGNTTFNLNNGSSGGATAGDVRWGQAWETGTTSVNDGQWHHVVFVCTGTTKTAYVDGNVDFLTPDSWSAAGLGNQFWIGGSADTGDGTANLNGLMDEVYVFDRAISAAEVQSLSKTNSLSGMPSVPGAVTVGSGATLAGNGTVGGPVTVQPSGTISAGAPVEPNENLSQSCRPRGTLVA